VKTGLLGGKRGRVWQKRGRGKPYHHRGRPPSLLDLEACDFFVALAFTSLLELVEEIKTPVGSTCKGSTLGELLTERGAPQ